MHTPALNELLTPRQVADRLGVSVPTIRRWIRDGQLDALRLGNGERASVRVSPAAVLRFVTVRPKEEPPV